MHKTYLFIYFLLKEQVDETFSIVNLIQAEQESRRSNHEYDSKLELESSYR